MSYHPDDHTAVEKLHSEFINRFDRVNDDLMTFQDAAYSMGLAREADLQQRLNEADQRVDLLEAALKFYADREHYHFESGNWDTVSGEPLNILWCGDEPDFIEDGTVARSVLAESVRQLTKDSPEVEL